MTLFDRLNGVSPHLQAVALRSCSFMSLCSLAQVSRSTRHVALLLLSRMHIDIVVTNQFPSYIRFEVRDKSSGELFRMKHDYRAYAAAPDLTSLPTFWDVLTFLLQACRVNTLELDFITLDNYFAYRLKSDLLLAPREKIEIHKLIIRDVSYPLLYLLDWLTPKYIDFRSNSSTWFDQEINFDRLRQEIVEVEAVLVLGNMPPTAVDDVLLNLRSPSILITIDSMLVPLPLRLYTQWTPSGIAKFIGQWQSGVRVIDRLVAAVHLPVGQNAALFTSLIGQAVLGAADPPTRMTRPSQPWSDFIMDTLHKDFPLTRNLQYFYDVRRIYRADGCYLYLVVRQTIFPGCVSIVITHSTPTPPPAA